MGSHLSQLHCGFSLLPNKSKSAMLLAAKQKRDYRVTPQ